jgi:hypothetical protein
MKHIRIVAGIASLLFVPFLLATQVIPQLVNPQIGENIWQIVYREGITLDDVLDTTTLCCNCDFFITQADIDLNGGGFTITQPGNWCLGENIVTSASITVTGVSNASIDLKGRSITSSIANGAIINVDTCPNIVVKNGTIIGEDLAGTIGARQAVAFTNCPNALTQNIRAKFFGSVDNVTGAQSGTGFFADGTCPGINFNKCFATGPFLTGFSTSSDSSILTNCEVNNFSGDLISFIGTVLVSGVGYAINGPNSYLENCKSVGGPAQPTPASAGSTGFVIQAANISLNNCIATNHKVAAVGTSALIIAPGNGFFVSGNNCEIRNSLSAYNEDTGIFNTGIGLVVCNNSVHDNTTNFVGTSDSSLCTLILGAAGCDFMITQDDIGAGGVYTITQPGKYCLAELVTYTTSNAITINSPNVVLELNNHPMIRTTVNGAPSTTGAIVCNGAFCIIQNGDITSDTIILNSTGITVRNCNLNGDVFNPTGIIVSAAASSCNIMSSEISNTITGTGITVNGNATVVDGCTVIGASEGIAVNGTRTVIQNCVMQNNTHNGLFSTPTVLNLAVENCIAEFNAQSGFRIDGSNGGGAVNVTVNNCKARFNGGSLIVPSYGIVVGFINNLQANFDGVLTYHVVNDYGIRVTNNNGKGNTNGDMVMVLTITDPAHVQPTITDIPKVIYPPVGFCTGNNGGWVQDANNTNTIMTPGVAGSNLALA